MFNTIDHDILLDKLSLYRIRGTVKKLFLCYLRKRQQYVQIQHIKSDLRSLLSYLEFHRVLFLELVPLLSLLYVNDMVKV